VIVISSLHAGAALGDPRLDLRRLTVQAGDEVLEVEDDVGDVLADAGEGGELVRDSLDLHRGHRCALERGEQHAAQRIAERVAEAAVERLDHELAAAVVHFLVDDARNLELHQTGPGSQRCSLLLLASLTQRRQGVAPYFE
jgi:hypothetical protein